MPDSITTTPAPPDQVHDEPHSGLSTPPFGVGDVIQDLADQVNLLGLAIAGLRVEVGRGHDRSFDAAETLCQEVAGYAEALRAWAHGREPEWRVGDRADRLLRLVTQLEDAAAAARAK